MAAGMAPALKLKPTATEPCRPATASPFPSHSATRPRQGSKPAGAVLVGMVLLAGLLLVPFRVLGIDFGTMPGTFDTRFNLVILEHGWRYLTGKDTSFWDAPFYHPQPLVIAYSDSHLGALPLYALFRAVGLDRETSFQAWFFTFFPLNFFACYWALRNLSFGPVAAAAGAYIFAFALPVIGQFEHLQLLPRFPIPLAFYFGVRVCERGRGRHWIGLAAAVIYQFYAAVYLGYFLCLLLALFLPIYLALRRPGVLRAWAPAGDPWALLLPGSLVFFGLVVRRAQPGCAVALVSLAVADALRRLGWRGWMNWAWVGLGGGSWRAVRRRLAGLTLIGAALVPPFLPYLYVYHQRGGHAPSSILSLLPRPESWLSAPKSSVLWGSWDAKARGLDPREQNLFLGLLPTLALPAAVVLAFRHRRGRLRDLVIASLLAFAALFLVTLMTPMGSLYQWLFNIPGVTAIRAVARIILVLLLPVGVAVAFCLTALENRLRRGVGTVTAALLTAALLPFGMIDQLTAPDRIGSFAKAEYQEHIRAAVAQVLRQTPDVKLLLAVTPGQLTAEFPGWLKDEGHQLYGMEVAQAVGVPTVNGYSAHAPHGWAPLRRWSDLEQWKHVARSRLKDKHFRQQSWYAAHGFDGLAVLGALKGTPGARLSVCYAPLPQDAFRARLCLASPVPRLTAGKAAPVVVEVSNRSSIDWPALSWNGGQFRVGAGQRWLRPDGTDAEKWGGSRAWLDEDVPAGRTTRLELELIPPLEPGHYVVEVNLVQEEVAWFSERGSPSLRLKVDVE